MSDDTKPTTPRTPTPVLADALDVLARDIQSDDGVANAAIAEAAARLRELRGLLERAAAARSALHSCLAGYSAVWDADEEDEQAFYLSNEIAADIRRELEE